MKVWANEQNITIDYNAMTVEHIHLDDSTILFVWSVRGEWFVDISQISIPTKWVGKAIMATYRTERWTAYRPAGYPTRFECIDAKMDLYYDPIPF